MPLGTSAASQAQKRRQTLPAWGWELEQQLPTTLGPRIWATVQLQLPFHRCGLPGPVPCRVAAPCPFSGCEGLPTTWDPNSKVCVCGVTTWKMVTPRRHIPCVPSERCAHECVMQQGWSCWGVGGSGGLGVHEVSALPGACVGATTQRA